METVTDFIFLGSKITTNGDCSLHLGKKAMAKLDSIKKQRHHFANKDTYSLSYCFSGSHVWIWELDHKEGWLLMNWCYGLWCWRTLESPLDSKEIQPVHSKGNQSWIFIGRTDPEAEAPILWLPDAKSQLITKDPDAGKNWSQEKKGTTQDKMFGWHYWLNGHKFEQALGDHEGQGSLVCGSTQGRKESDMTERLNNISRDGRMLFPSKKNAVSLNALKNIFKMTA